MSNSYIDPTLEFKYRNHWIYVENIQEKLVLIKQKFGDLSKKIIEYWMKEELIEYEVRKEIDFTFHMHLHELQYEYERELVGEIEDIGYQPFSSEIYDYIDFESEDRY